MNVAVKLLHTKLNFFFGILKFWLRHIIYMHLLTWVGFGLMGYVPNTLFKLWGKEGVIGVTYVDIVRRLKPSDNESFRLTLLILLVLRSPEFRQSLNSITATKNFLFVVACELPKRESESCIVT
jgi:hypothetical protein